MTESLTSVAARAPSTALTKTVRGFCFGGGTDSRAHHASHGSHHAQNAVESFIFRLVITDMYMLCAM